MLYGNRTLLASRESGDEATQAHVTVRAFFLPFVQLLCYINLLVYVDSPIHVVHSTTAKNVAVKAEII